jgi:DnaJ-class molecular chaperone
MPEFWFDCPACNGLGETYDDPDATRRVACERCEGSGVLPYPTVPATADALGDGDGGAD